jgi:hypothetical protein
LLKQGLTMSERSVGRYAYQILAQQRFGEAHGVLTRAAE